MKNIIFCTAKENYIADYDFYCNISILYHKINKIALQNFSYKRINLSNAYDNNISRIKMNEWRLQLLISRLGNVTNVIFT